VYVLRHFYKTLSSAPLDGEVVCDFEWSCKQRRRRMRETVRGDLGVIESLQNGFFNTRTTHRAVTIKWSELTLPSRARDS